MATKILWFANQSIDEAVFNFVSLNPVIAESIKSIDPAIKDKLLQSLANAFEPFMTNEGLIFDSATWIVSAKK